MGYLQTPKTHTLDEIMRAAMQASVRGGDMNPSMGVTGGLGSDLAAGPSVGGDGLAAGPQADPFAEPAQQTSEDKVSEILRLYSKIAGPAPTAASVSGELNQTLGPVRKPSPLELVLTGIADAAGLVSKFRGTPSVKPNRFDPDTERWDRSNRRLQPGPNPDATTNNTLRLVSGPAQRSALVNETLAGQKAQRAKLMAGANEAILQEATKAIFKKKQKEELTLSVRQFLDAKKLESAGIVPKGSAQAYWKKEFEGAKAGNTSTSLNDFYAINGIEPRSALTPDQQKLWNETQKRQADLKARNDPMDPGVRTRKVLDAKTQWAKDQGYVTPDMKRTADAAAAKFQPDVDSATKALTGLNAKLQKALMSDPPESAAVIQSIQDEIAKQHESLGWFVKAREDAKRAALRLPLGADMPPSYDPAKDQSTDAVADAIEFRDYTLYGPQDWASWDEPTRAAFVAQHGKPPEGAQ